jgi:hypothetical protein
MTWWRPSTCLLTTHCYILSNISCFVIYKVRAFRLFLDFVDPELTCSFRHIGFERCHVSDQSPSSYVRLCYFPWFCELTLVINSKTPNTHECKVYWDGGLDKIKEFRTQHAPMCSSNWVCTRLRLKDTVVKQDDNVTDILSPKRTVHRQSVNFLVNWVLHWNNIWWWQQLEEIAASLENGRINHPRQPLPPIMVGATLLMLYPASVCSISLSFHRL